LKSIILFNNPCSEEKCSKEASARSKYGINLPRRYFESNNEKSVLSFIDASLIAGNETVIMIPIDVDNDGRLDIIL
jgi:hypothetical protein